MLKGDFGEVSDKSQEGVIRYWRKSDPFHKRPLPQKPQFPDPHSLSRPRFMSSEGCTYDPVDPEARCPTKED